jgi:integration host factor subunit beta
MTAPLGVDLMNRVDLIEEISHALELTRKESEIILDTIFESMVKALRSGRKIEIRGFGSFVLASDGLELGRYDCRTLRQD